VVKPRVSAASRREVPPTLRPAIMLVKRVLRQVPIRKSDRPVGSAPLPFRRPSAAFAVAHGGWQALRQETHLFAIRMTLFCYSPFAGRTRRSMVGGMTPPLHVSRSGLGRFHDDRAGTFVHWRLHSLPKHEIPGDGLGSTVRLELS
jgi:hypothetical protein